MKAIWLIWSRRQSSRIGFWTSLVGVDLRKLSFGQSVYLVYVTVFFSLWGFAVLSLTANLGAALLSLFSGIPVTQVAVNFLVFTLLGYAILRGFTAGRQSPFLFSEEDAQLLCQTPVDRRQVILAWTIMDWFQVALFFGALSWILSFANLQLMNSNVIVWSRLPIYLLEGLRVISIILPVSLGITAAAFILGAIRLRRDSEYSFLQYIPIVVGVLLISLELTSPSIAQKLLAVVIFPLESGFGLVAWWPGFALSAFMGMLGLVTLYSVSRDVNLSRAAQESQHQLALQLAGILGDSGLRRELKTHQRLGIGHPASSLPGRKGVWVLLWKDCVINLRSMTLNKFFTWIGVFSLNLGMMIAPDWETRLFTFIIWCLLVGQLGAEHLRSDLGLWVITRQLPFSGTGLIVTEMVLPAVVGTVLSWLAFGVSILIGFSPPIAFIVFAPAAIVCIILAADFDILQHSRSSFLLDGRVPEMGAGGLILSLLSAGFPLFLTLLIMKLSEVVYINWLIIMAGLIINITIAYWIWRLTALKYAAIK